jgi:hypothetical protein
MHVTRSLYNHHDHSSDVFNLHFSVRFRALDFYHGLHGGTYRVVSQSQLRIPVYLLLSSNVWHCRHFGVVALYSSTKFARNSAQKKVVVSVESPDMLQLNCVLKDLSNYTNFLFHVCVYRFCLFRPRTTLSSCCTAKRRFFLV